MHATAIWPAWSGPSAPPRPRAYLAFGACWVEPRTLTIQTAAAHKRDLGQRPGPRGRIVSIANCKACVDSGVAMGFYFRIAPGVKIRATSRGIRTSLGPRGARLHLGAGGPGVSTGTGPFTYYHSLSGGGSTPGSTCSGVSAREAKAELAAELGSAWTRLLKVHEQSFPTAVRPKVPALELPDRDEYTAVQVKAAVKTVPFWRRSRRAQARDAAMKSAASSWDDLASRAAEQRALEQAQADSWWATLLANDPETVASRLQEAFSDNEVPAAAVHVDGFEVALAMLTLREEVIPDRMPGVTDAGNPSIRKMSRSSRSALIGAITFGFLLVTLRETFAVAPGIRSTRVVVLRPTSPDAYGAVRLECVLAGRWQRDSLAGVKWGTVDAATIAQDTADELLSNVHSDSVMRSLDLTKEPELVALIQRVDLEELTSGA